MILVPLFDLKFLNELAATERCRNFKSAALELHFLRPEGGPSVLV